MGRCQAKGQRGHRCGRSRGRGRVELKTSVFFDSLVVVWLHLKINTVNNIVIIIII